MGSKTVKVPIGMRSSYFAKIKTEPENAHPTYDTVLDMGAAVKWQVAGGNGYEAGRADPRGQGAQQFCPACPRDGGTDKGRKS